MEISDLLARRREGLVLRASAAPMATTLLALSSLALRPRLQLCLSTRSLLRRASSSSSPARATPADLAALRAIVGDAYVLEGASEDAAPFQLDWLRQYPGRAAAVVRSVT